MADPDFTRYDLQIVDESTTPDTEINLLAFNEQQPTTKLLPLRPVKLETGNPIETRPESGDPYGQNDFRGGAGQKLFHRQGRDDTAYLYSQGLDVSKEGRISLLRSFTSAHTAADAVNGYARAGSNLFIATAGAILRTSDLSSFTSDAASLGHHIISEGSRIFYANSSAIRVRDSAGAHSDYFSQAGGFSILFWAKERLFAVGTAATSRVLYEINPTGPAATAIHTVAEGWAFQKDGFADVGPYIYAAAVGPHNESRIYHYGLNSGATGYELKGETLMPVGDAARSLTEMFGQVFVSAGRRGIGGDSGPVAYYGVPSDTGELALVYITSFEGSGGGAHYASAPVGSNIVSFWAWQDVPENFPATTQDEIVLYYDPIREAFWFGASPGGDAGGSDVMTSFNGRLVVSREESIYVESTSSYVTSGVLYTSTADWNNAGQKLWDEIEVTLRPLPANVSIAVAYTTGDPLDSATTWTTAGTIDADGTTSQRFSLSGVVGRRLTLRFTFTSDGSATPTLLSYSVRSYPKPATAEYLLKRYVRLQKQGRKDERAPAVRQKPRTVRKQLLALGYSRVLLKEPDAVWNGRITDIEDMEPANPEPDETRAGREEEMYVMAITMEATLVS